MILGFVFIIERAALYLEHALFQMQGERNDAEFNPTRLMSILWLGRLTRAGRNGREFAFFARLRLAFVTSVTASQKRNFIQDMLLKPLEPEIDYRRDE
jgi:hypothetical protein